MGNDICSEVSTYCAAKEEATTMVIYEYPTIQPKNRVKQIQLPELVDEVKTVLAKKGKNSNYLGDYLVDFVQKECYIKKKYFGDDIYEGELNSVIHY